MKKDKHQERIKAVKRASRIELGGIGGKAGIHADKQERRVRHMGTKEWLEEAEEDEVLREEIELAAYESRLRDESGPGEEPTVACSLCGGQVSIDMAHLHQDRWIGECCWDERLKTTE